MTDEDRIADAYKQLAEDVHVRCEDIISESIFAGTPIPVLSRDQLGKRVKRLPKRQAEVVGLFYGLDGNGPRTVLQIMDQLGISRPSVVRNRNDGLFNFIWYVVSTIESRHSATNASIETALEYLKHSELERWREIGREIVSVRDADYHESCPFCHETPDYTDIKHATDCPVTQARVLLMESESQL